MFALERGSLLGCPKEGAHLERKGGDLSRCVPSFLWASYRLGSGRANKGRRKVGVSVGGGNGARRSPLHALRGALPASLPSPFPPPPQPNSPAKGDPPQSNAPGNGGGEGETPRDLSGSPPRRVSKEKPPTSEQRYRQLHPGRLPRASEGWDSPGRQPHLSGGCLPRERGQSARGGQKRRRPVPGISPSPPRGWIPPPLEQIPPPPLFKGRSPSFATDPLPYPACFSSPHRSLLSKAQRASLTRVRGEPLPHVRPEGGRGLLSSRHA